jgi:hypothetical protein
LALDLEGRVEVDSAFGDLIPRVWIESSHDEAKGDGGEVKYSTEYSVYNLESWRIRTCHSVPRTPSKYVTEETRGKKQETETETETETRKITGRETGSRFIIRNTREVTGNYCRTNRRQDTMPQG